MTIARRHRALPLLLLAFATNHAWGQISSYTSSTGEVRIPFLYVDGGAVAYDVQLRQRNAGTTFELLSASATPPASSTVAVGGSIDAAMDRSVYIAGTNYALRLVAVTEDSRCPQDIACISAGQATAVFSIWENGKHVRDMVLGTAPGALSKSLGNLSVTLSQLLPQPVTGATTSASSYVATLEVKAQ